MSNVIRMTIEFVLAGTILPVGILSWLGFLPNLTGNNGAIGGLLVLFAVLSLALGFLDAQQINKVTRGFGGR